MPRFVILSAVLLMIPSAFSQQCRVQFDARVPAGSKPGSFDAKTSVFRTDAVIGEGKNFMNSRNFSYSDD